MAKKAAKERTAEDRSVDRLLVKLAEAESARDTWRATAEDAQRRLREIGALAEEG